MYGLFYIFRERRTGYKYFCMYLNSHVWRTSILIQMTRSIVEKNDFFAFRLPLFLSTTYTARRTVDSYDSHRYSDIHKSFSDSNIRRLSEWIISYAVTYHSRTQRFISWNVYRGSNGANSRSSRNFDSHQITISFFIKNEILRTHLYEIKTIAEETQFFRYNIISQVSNCFICIHSYSVIHASKVRWILYVFHDTSIMGYI